MNYEQCVNGIERALEREHCYQCEQSEQNACGINAAYRNGYTLIAAYLLSSATECPKTEKALQRAQVLYKKKAGTHLYDNVEWDEWKEFFEHNTVQCTKCGSYVFTDESEQFTCGNCRAALPKKSEEEQEEEEGANAQ